MSPLRAVVLRTDDHEVAVRDVGLDHRVAADPEDVGVAGRREHVRDRHRLGRVLVGLDRAAGRDLADDRQDVGVARDRLRRQLRCQAKPEGGRGREPDGS